jgi:hypothetical protein
MLFYFCSYSIIYIVFCLFLDFFFLLKGLPCYGELDTQQELDYLPEASQHEEAL